MMPRQPKPPAPKGAKVPRQCTDTVAMRAALGRLRNALRRTHTGNARGQKRISHASVARGLGIATRTLFRWLDMAMWPPDHRLPDILATAAVIEEAANGHYERLERMNSSSHGLFSFSIDTGSVAGYTCAMPAVEPPPDGWLVETGNRFPPASRAGVGGSFQSGHWNE